MLSNQILESVKPFIEKEVYADVKEELQDSFQDELDKKDSLCRKIQEELDTTRKELENSNQTITQLRRKLENANSDKTYQNFREQSKGAFVLAESIATYGPNNSVDENLKSAAIKYKDSTLGELKNSIKPKKANDTCKLGDLLLNQPNDLFS